MTSGSIIPASSSPSSSSSSSGVTIATDELSTALSGYVKTFSSSSSGRSAGAIGETGVKSLVQLYLLIDESYKYPVAKVKSKSDGSFTITIIWVNILDLCRLMRISKLRSLPLIYWLMSSWSLNICLRIITSFLELVNTIRG